MTDSTQSDQLLHAAGVAAAAVTDLVQSAQEPDPVSALRFTEGLTNIVDALQSTLLCLQAGDLRPAENQLLGAVQRFMDGDA